MRKNAYLRTTFNTNRSYMEQALKTLSEALAIANAKCKELEAERIRLQAANENLIDALTTANHTIKELTSKQKTIFTPLYCKGSNPTKTAVIIRLRPAANDK